MLYETASRASAVLALNVEDCDFDNRRARVTVKGGHTEWIVWGRGTALLLPRHLHGRTRGPLFCSDRRPGPARRATTISRDVCPDTGRARLGYDRARVLIAQHTGLSLHTLRTPPPPTSAKPAPTPASTWPKATGDPSAPPPATPAPASPPSPPPPNSSTHRSAAPDQTPGGRCAGYSWGGLLGSIGWSSAATSTWASHCRYSCVLQPQVTVNCSKIPGPVRT